MFPISEAKSVLDFSLTKSIIPKVFSESEKFKRPKTPISRENLSESTTH